MKGRGGEAEKGGQNKGNHKEEELYVIVQVEFH